MTIYTIKHALLLTITLLASAAVTFAAEPGSPNAIWASNEQQPGSILVYNYYKSSASDPTENTKFTITNVSTVKSVAVHFFLVATNCQVADAFICLTASQTASFLASDVDPGVTGYAIFVASDPATGIPIGFNVLIGSEHVKLASGHQAKLNAESFQALFEGPVQQLDLFQAFAKLDLDGVSYTQAPRVLALDHIPSNADGNSTLLVINSVSGNLAYGATTLGNLFGVLYDDAESAFSFTASGACQIGNVLSNNFPRTTPRFEQVIPAGRSGWMKLFSLRDRAITGAAITFNSSSNTNPASFNGGSNLHHLSQTGAASLSIPVFPPSC